MTRWGGAHRATARGIGWGLGDQCLSSATNFALFLLAGRTLGPDGLGLVFIGFSAYLVALGLQRALVTDPLISLSAPLERHEQLTATRSGLSAALLAATAASAAVAAIGLIAPGDVGRGLLLVAPWLLPALIQDFWRTVLFRDGRLSTATLNDGCWLGVMSIAAVGALLIGTEWAIIGCWGLGATGGAALGLVQTRTRPAGPRQGWLWWRTEAWPFGRWLGVNGLVYSSGSYVIVVLLVALVGTRSLGGLRAVESIFAPLSLIAPAVGLWGLPAVSRALATSTAAARKLALELGAAAAILTGSCVLVLGLGGRWLMPLLFGRQFARYASLIWPVGAGQLATAGAIGIGLLLKAQRRGRAILAAGAVSSAGSLILAGAFARADGVSGAAWGLAAGSAAGALTMAGCALIGSTASTTRRLTPVVPFAGAQARTLLHWDWW